MKDHAHQPAKERPTSHGTPLAELVLANVSAYDEGAMRAEDEAGMKPRISSILLLLFRILLVPGGIGLWITGMCLAMQGGGAWTEPLMAGGVLMIGFGLLLELTMAVCNLTRGIKSYKRDRGQSRP